MCVPKLASSARLVRFLRAYTNCIYILCIHFVYAFCIHGSYASSGTVESGLDSGLRARVTLGSLIVNAGWEQSQERKRRAKPFLSNIGTAKRSNSVNATFVLQPSLVARSVYVVRSSTEAPYRRSFHKSYLTTTTLRSVREYASGKNSH